MKPVLEFLKTHMISLICAVVSVACIGLAVVSMTSDAVVKAMEAEKQRTSATAIDSMKSSAKNEEVIKKEQERVAALDKEYRDTLKVAEDKNRRQPLMAGVFPKPASDAVRADFRDTYAERMLLLPTEMNAETLPTPNEIAEEEQNVIDLQALEAEQRDETKTDDSRSPAAGVPTPPIAAPPTRGGFTSEGVIGGGGRFGGAGPRGFSMPGMGAQVSDQTPPKYNPVLRARVAKARSIRCYVDQNTFHVSPIAYNESPPPPDEMWYAQMGLWIQEDIVKAIDSLNKEAAEKIKDTDASVEHMPVKRLVAVRLQGYELGGGKRLPLAGGSASSGATESFFGGGPCFTDRSSNDQFDVVRFEALVVVDQRELMRLIDRISKQNFYTCVNMGYEAVDRAQDERQEGYFYGTAPVVRARLDFEGYFARSLFDQLKPEAVSIALGQKSGEGQP